MRIFVSCFSLVSVFPILVFAGPLYGTVREQEKPAAGVSIVVACPSLDQARAPLPLAATDASGSFSVRVPFTGRCEMRAQRGGTVGAPFEVFVSDNPLRFDVDVDAGMNRTR